LITGGGGGGDGDGDDARVRFRHTAAGQRERIPRVTTDLTASALEIISRSRPQAWWGGDSNTPMPAVDTCQIGQQDDEPLPDPHCIPCARTHVTQATINSTICLSPREAATKAQIEHPRVHSEQYLRVCNIAENRMNKFVIKKSRVCAC